jgi:hypothetical protein
MEPENNIELVIRGYLESGHRYPLIIIGNTQNKYGQFLFRKYATSSIRFPGAVYNTVSVDALRHFSTLYFHGHSVGGTNPSLLEAMACRCNIAAHDNVFNKAILGTDASYFSTADDVKKVLNQPLQEDVTSRHCHHNIEKSEQPITGTKSLMIMKLYSHKFYWKNSPLELTKNIPTIFAFTWY